MITTYEELRAELQRRSDGAAMALQDGLSQSRTRGTAEGRAQFKREVLDLLMGTLTRDPSIQKIVTAVEDL